MNSRILKIVGVGVAIAVAACVDLSAPDGKPASISQVQVPAFFVVQGDTMRDTLGTAVPLSIIAYDGAGNVVTSFDPNFFVTDSVPAVKINPDRTVSATEPGDTAGATAHIIAQIAGLATSAQTIYVTVRPATLARPSTALDTLRLAFGTDSAKAIATKVISTVVQGIDGRPVPGVFVRYTLETAVPSTSQSSPAAYLRDDGNRIFPAGISTPDTGDASGGTSRTVVVNGAFAGDNIANIDTLYVVATAMYRGVPLVNSPLRIPVFLLH